MIGNIIAAIVIGIIAGYLGRALLPGDDSMGFIATVAVGIVGALVGYFLFTTVLGIGDDDKFDLGGILGSIVGVMIVLLGAARRRRQRQGPRRPHRGRTRRLRVAAEPLAWPRAAVPARGHRRSPRCARSSSRRPAAR